MKVKLGKAFVILASVAAVVGFILYLGSAFSGDYGPLPGVEILLVVLAVLGIVESFILPKLRTGMIVVLQPVLCMIAMFALVFSFYTMVTPIGYVIANLNPFSEISRWVAATVCMGISFVFHVIALFFPLYDEA